MGTSSDTPTPGVFRKNGNDWTYLEKSEKKSERVKRQ
jgi:hypothetical protein